MSDRSALTLAREALELAEHATPGPWYGYSNDDLHCVGTTYPTSKHVGEQIIKWGGFDGNKQTNEQNQNNVDLIAHAGTSYATVARAAIEMADMLAETKGVHRHDCAILKPAFRVCDCGQPERDARIDALTKEGEHD